jgi:hypothetical protein
MDPHSAGFFLVNSCYTFLQNKFLMDLINTNTETASVWLNDVLSKVSILGWRLLLEKIPTREVL